MLDEKFCPLFNGFCVKWSCIFWDSGSCAVREAADAVVRIAYAAESGSRVEAD